MIYFVLTSGALFLVAVGVVLGLLSLNYRPGDKPLDRAFYTMLGIAFATIALAFINFAYTVLQKTP